jgi:hypothetical protein
MTRWIGSVDSNRSEVRQQAAEQLERLGEVAEPALRDALAAKPSAAAQRELEALLNKVGQLVATPSPDRLQWYRMLEVLERIGLPEANAMLTRLAQGDPAAPVTREANAALQRMAKRPKASAPRSR